MMVEQLAIQNLIGTFGMFHLAEDNSTSIISALHSGIQLDYSQRDSAKVYRSFVVLLLRIVNPSETFSETFFSLLIINSYLT